MAKRRKSALADAIGQVERQSAGVGRGGKPSAPRFGSGRQRFGAGQKVDAATAERTAMRLNRLTGARPHGINVSDGVTGREARLAREAVANERPVAETAMIKRDPRRPVRPQGRTYPAIWPHPARRRRTWA